MLVNEREIGARRPWSSLDQRRLVTGLQAGLPPTRLCRDLHRGPADVRHHVTTLLGDRPTASSSDPITDLDMLWMRLRAGSVLPTPPTAIDVVTAWQDATGIRLTAVQRTELAAEDAVDRLAALGRHALRERATRVVAATGMLDLDDWLHADDGGAPPQEATSRRLLHAAVEDVTPELPRLALRAHLRLTVSGTGPTLPSDAARHERARAVLEALRAGGLPGSPAAVLRDRLLDDAALRALIRDLAVDVPAATTLGLLGGRHEVHALRVAGEALTRWHRPSNLGRGVVVHLRS